MKRTSNIYKGFIAAVGSIMILFGIIMPITFEKSAVIGMMVVVVGALLDSWVICKALQTH